MPDCPNRKANLKKCGCTYAECEKKGMCCECIRYHKGRGEIPGCLFPSNVEKTFDRSVDKFVQSMRC